MGKIEDKIREDVRSLIETGNIFGEEVRAIRPDGTSYITHDTQLLENSLVSYISKNFVPITTPTSGEKEL